VRGAISPTSSFTNINRKISSYRGASFTGRSVARVLARHPGLRLGALLSLPALWLVVAYLGSLAAMFVTAFWTTDTFTGSLDQNGTAIYPFTVTSAGYGLLAGYTSISPASVTALGIGIGSWDATASSCSLNLSQNDTGRSGSTALSGTPSNGNYCVRIYDAGNIPAGVAASFTVQVQHY